MIVYFPLNSFGQLFSLTHFHELMTPYTKVFPSVIIDVQKTRIKYRRITYTLPKS